MSIMNGKLKITKDLDLQFKDLCKVVDFDSPFTLGDIIHIVNSSSYISKKTMAELVNCNYLGDYFNEMQNPFLVDKEDVTIEYLEVKWKGDKAEFDSDIYMDSGWEFDGVGEKGVDPMAKEKGLTEIDPEFREGYAIEFTPVNKLAHLQIKMCPKMYLYSREKDENNKNIFNDVKVLFTPDISLLDLLYAIFYELSMMGNLEQRDEQKNILSERLNSAKKQMDNGTLVTHSWEEVRGRLNKVIEEIKIKREAKKEEKERNMTVLPNNYVGFAVDKKSSRDIESIAVISTCTLNKIPFKIVNGAKEFKKDAAYCQYIPVGNIDFVQDVLEVKVKPNYYPEYLREYFKREIWETNEWPLGKKVFIKPSDKYKRFTGFVTNGGYKKKKKPPYVCSEVINIKNEWRYYICNGKILFVNWYAGREDIEIDAPQININFDETLCCCLDMGELLNGDIVLIEQQHPFSCGWYGKCTTENNAKYTKWLAYGWDSLRNAIYG